LGEVEEVALGLALLAAVLFGLGTVAQARAVCRLKAGPARRGRRLVTDAGWLGGTACMGVGVLVHTAALRYGSLLVVQPIAYSALLVAIPTEAVLQRRFPSRSDLLAAGQIALGLGVLTVLLRVPHAAHPAAAMPVLWTVLVLAVAGFLLLRPARRHRRSARAAVWGLVAGGAMALSSALVRSTAVAVAADGVGALLSWSVPGLLAAGAVGLVLEQRAYAEGRLAAALGAQDAAGLLISVLLGVILLGDLPQLTVGAASGTLLSLLLVTHGVVRLARAHSPTTGPADVDSRVRTPGSPPDNRLLTGPVAR